MPHAPDLGTLATWKADTDRSLHKRSDALVNIDNLLDGYNQMGRKPTQVEWLGAALGVWIVSKTKNDVLKTIRDHSGAVGRLKRLVEITLAEVPPVPYAPYPGISIAHDNYRGDEWVPDAFVGDTTAALVTIASKPVGRTLLERISARCNAAGKQVIIEYTPRGAQAAPLDDISPANRKKIQVPANQSNDPDFVKRTMANVNILAHATNNLLREGTIKEFVSGGGAHAVCTWKHDFDGNPPRPRYIALAHELVHALHYVEGNCYRGIGDGITLGGNTGYMEEEMRTVGFGRYAAESPSENAIRAENNVPLRPSYVPNDNWATVISSLHV